MAHPLYADVNNWKVGDRVELVKQRGTATYFDGTRATVTEIEFLSANILLTLLFDDGERQEVSFVNVKKIGTLDRLAEL